MSKMKPRATLQGSVSVLLKPAVAQGSLEPFLAREQGPLVALVSDYLVRGPNSLAPLAVLAYALARNGPCAPGGFSRTPVFFQGLA